MKVLELELTDDTAARLEQVACRQGVSVEDLLRLSVEEKLARDAEFERAAAVVLEKNAELYRRLA